MKAVILAAGKGTRMKYLTADKPKPMVDVGKELILERILGTIRDAGICDFIVVTGYFGNIIEEHFKDGRDFGMNIRYVRQEVQDGTGSALHLTRDAVGDEPFYMS
ncbi:MAG TPA: sugar phosphate nucleotidyltransferase, partial [bacterium]|nr:sugar phosphate nucleotidyltransferase [bacterium]